MKSKVLLSLVFSLFLIFFLSNISAELNTTQINHGYSCLQNKTANCSTSLDDNIFTLLSINTCKSQVLQASTNETCWPKGTCNVRQTAQALLALRESGSPTSKVENWLISKNRTASNIEWYLQIESSEATDCSISYGSTNQISISIGANKEISSENTGNCLSPAQNNYWLAISPSAQCQKYEYTISCDKDFLTSTLFKKSDSSVINVGEKIHSASSSPSSPGTTTEQINSLCFADGQACSYEGTLWASLVLDSMDRDISPYVPYLVTMADDNPKTLPESFLYRLLGDDYKNDLLLKQKSNQYWEASGNKYYDTALALLALGSADASDAVTAKTNALDWLGDTQGTDGCWQGSIKNTAFLLYSISPGTFNDGGDGGDGDNGTGGDNGNTSGLNCLTNNYYCMSTFSCSSVEGNVLDNYQCSGLDNCCDKPKQTLASRTCAEQSGELCSGNEQCVGGIFADASDADYEECCIRGECIIPEEESECATSGGTCTTSVCASGEKSDTSLDCTAPSEICCIETSAQPSSLTSSLWIWIILALIALLILMIIFRDGLRGLWFRIKSSFKPSGPSSGAQHTPSYFGAPMRRMIPRRILPNTGSGHHGPAPVRRSGGELDDVLKKLKDMSR